MPGSPRAGTGPTDPRGNVLFPGFGFAKCSPKVGDTTATGGVGRRPRRSWDIELQRLVVQTVVLKFFQIGKANEGHGELECGVHGWVPCIFSRPAMFQRRLARSAVGTDGFGRRSEMFG